MPYSSCAVNHPPTISAVFNIKIVSTQHFL